MNNYPTILNWLNNELSSNSFLSNIAKISNITKVDLGLTNEIYIIQAQKSDNTSQSLFMKKFGISCPQIFNRPFENQIIKLLSSNNLIPKSLGSDLINYSIEEYMSNISSPSFEELFDQNFLQNLIDILIKQQLTCELFLSSKNNSLRTIWSYFDTIVPLAQS